MIIKKNIIKSEFINRPNRFQAYVKINGVETMVHVPNTGRCKEILIPGCTVILRQEDNPNRKTAYDLIAAYKGDVLINIDSQIPNKVVEEALNDKRIELLSKYNKVQREKTFGNSRFDFKLTDELENECYVEVKGVTLEEDGKVMFPDAPTERGKKHLLELVEVKKCNKDAAVIFLIQMENVNYFSPNDTMDKAFSDALRFAEKNGVHVMAYNCKVGEDFITLYKSIPVKL
ncbi:XRE family transcriptional regulator [Clostridium carboxidivorans P7]|uniref:Sugar fermentation stimulation protein homolog n=1 Tax=Clostridium carboxidivorans P7 TaxID=536227 RepID=C6PYY4_9CLOT|nr:DNA/RNA nuclease SfsA [Clostridium carboxidivorans]AKN33168.1 XRE family transcriptional regulator [Clostridium carboxidivorans P7]EET85567.1 sugar fermentation stimulation protein [Clostridium carboxidivorans P7]EFG86964.1 sugar fermentation stimulation protein [Clostridium carboxidivorans P7]